MLGISLTDSNLQALKRLYEMRWTADVRNWKERDTDYCMWIVTCPDQKGNYITETDQCLTKTIDKILRRALK